MTDVICYACKQPQKLSKNNLCSYCYTNLATGHNEPPPRKTESKRIKPVPGTPRKKKYISQVTFIAISIILILLGLIMFIMHGNHFPWNIKGQVSFKFIAFTSVITTILFYTILNIRYDMHAFILDNFSRSKGGRELSESESYLMFFFTTIFLSGLLSFVIVPMLNNFSSIFSQPHIHKTFLNNKTYHKGSKGGYSYYAEFTSWVRDNKTNITLEIDNKKEWDKLVPQRSYQIKVKKGIFADAIWGLKPDS